MSILHPAIRRKSRRRGRRGCAIERRRSLMSASVLYMSMSLDGYIAGPNDSPDNPGGDDFDRLHEWIFTAEPGWNVRPSGPARDFHDEGNATGAVLAGRR